MPRELRQLNPEILQHRLPENYRDVVNQAEANVNRAVDEVIRGYEEHLNQLAKQLEEGRFSEEFNRSVTEIVGNARKSLDELEASVQALEKKLSDLPSTDTGKALADLAQGLSADAQTLQQKLAEARKKVQEVGTLSGKVLGSALRKFVTGGV